MFLEVAKKVNIISEELCYYFYKQLPNCLSLRGIYPLERIVDPPFLLKYRILLSESQAVAKSSHMNQVFSKVLQNSQGSTSATAFFIKVARWVSANFAKFLKTEKEQLVAYNLINHFRPMFHVCRKQVIGFYWQNVWKTPAEEWYLSNDAGWWPLSLLKKALFHRFFFKHFASKNQLPGLSVSATLFENGLIKTSDITRLMKTKLWRDVLAKISNIYGNNL